MVVNVLDNDVEQPGCLLDGVTQVPGLEDQGVARPLLLRRARHERIHGCDAERVAALVAAARIVDKHRLIARAASHAVPPVDTLRRGKVRSGARIKGGIYPAW